MNVIRLPKIDKRTGIHTTQDHQLVTREWSCVFDTKEYHFQSVNDLKDYLRHERERLFESASREIGRQIINEGCVHTESERHGETFLNWKYTIVVPIVDEQSWDDKLKAARLEAATEAKREAYAFYKGLIDSFRDFGGPASGIVNYVLDKITVRLV